MLNKYKNIFIVGIKGVALSNLAIILKKMGKNVLGSDIPEEFITDENLKLNNIKMYESFHPDFLPKDTDLLIYTGAHQGLENPQVKEAIKRKIKVFHSSELIKDLIPNFKTSIAVCGCHGKTTTSSLLSYTLLKLKVKPTYLVGTSTFNDCAGGDYGSNDNYFVIEGDEYGINPPIDKTPKLFYLPVNHVLATNIGFDHPDVYKDLDETKKVFRKFFQDKKLYLCSDDKNLMDTVKNLDRKQYKTYGFRQDADLRITNWRTTETGSSFSLVFGRDGACPVSTHDFTISLFGEKNVSNTAGVVLTLIDLGFKPEEIKEAIKEFKGSKRRFELVYSKDNTYLFDDYAHHPEEIEATIKAVKVRFPNNQLLIIFQPHTFSRTEILLDDFAQSLSLADYSLVAPIFTSARENLKDYKISSLDIEKKAKEKGYENVIAFENVEILTKKLSEIAKKGDIIFTMGAGDIYKIKNNLIKIIDNLI